MGTFCLDFAESQDNRNYCRKAISIPRRFPNGENWGNMVFLQALIIHDNATVTGNNIEALLLDLKASGVCNCKNSHWDGGGGGVTRC